MGEVLYEKKYPKESPEDLEELQRQLDAEEIEEHEMPTAEEFFKRLEEDYLYIPMPERKKKVANFIRTARKGHLAGSPNEVCHLLFPLRHGDVEIVLL